MPMPTAWAPAPPRGGFPNLQKRAREPDASLPGDAVVRIQRHYDERLSAAQGALNEGAAAALDACAAYTGFDSAGFESAERFAFFQGKGNDHLAAAVAITPHDFAEPFEYVCPLFVQSNATAVTAPIGATTCTSHTRENCGQ